VLLGRYLRDFDAVVQRLKDEDTSETEIMTNMLQNGVIFVGDDKAVEVTADTAEAQLLAKAKKVRRSKRKWRILHCTISEGGQT
jgi:hypothetical protein